MKHKIQETTNEKLDAFKKINLKLAKDLFLEKSYFQRFIIFNNKNEKVIDKVLFAKLTTLKIIVRHNNNSLKIFLPFYPNH